MPSAFVLVNSEMGAEDVVMQEIEKIKNVTEVYTVYGVYDIIVKVEAETMNELKEVVLKNIRQQPKVRSTITLTVM